MISRILFLLFIAVSAYGQAEKHAQTPRVNLVYSSDLYWPPDDPDDYFDLATLFAIQEIDVLGIILDQQLYSKRPQSEGTGAVPLKQIFSIAGRTAPFAIGLRTPLKRVGDPGIDQDSVCQEGVELLIRCLERSETPVVLLTVGTLRYIAAAYNRNPGLFRAKVSRIYLNAGIYGFPQGRFDVNLEKDRNAFLAIMKSGLSVYWAPCFGDDNYETFWHLDQRPVLETALPELQNYFLRAFSKGRGMQEARGDSGDADPVAILGRPVVKEEMERVYGMTRNMWSTVTFLHAAGLKIYRNNRGEYTASRQPIGDFEEEIKPYTFKKMTLSIDDEGRLHSGDPGNITVYVFHKDDPGLYRSALEGILKRKFSGF